MTTVLITGGTGLLGKALIAAVPAEIEPIATYRSKPISDKSSASFYPLDVRDANTVARLFHQVRPDVVIHTASIGSVDYAERHREEAWAVNTGGTRNVAESCRHHGAKLVFISSNAVFDGEHPPYAEEDTMGPLNYYGELKVEGERVVQEVVNEAAIIRPILMYGRPNPGRRGNLVTFWLDKFEKGDPVQVVDDVWSKPLQVENCAEVCWAIVKQERNGIYHVAGADHVTLYKFALRVAEVFGVDPGFVTPVPSSFFQQLTQRPKDTSFVTDKMERELGVRPVGLVEGLQRLKAQQPVHI